MSDLSLMAFEVERRRSSGVDLRRTGVDGGDDWSRSDGRDRLSKGVVWFSSEGGKEEKDEEGKE